MAKNNRQQRRNTFNNLNKPLSSMTANECSMLFDRVVRDLVKGNIDPYADAQKFTEPVFLGVMVDKAKKAYHENWTVSNALNFCLNASGTNVQDYQYAMHLIQKYNTLREVYWIINSEIEMIMQDGEPTPHLLSMMQSLARYKTTFRN